MSACRREFDETKYMSFLIKDDESLEKYNGIWEKLEITSKYHKKVQLICLSIILIDSVFKVSKDYYP